MHQIDTAVNNAAKRAKSRSGHSHAAQVAAQMRRNRS